MNRKTLCVVFAMFCSSVALGQNRGISANKPTCTTTVPQLFIVIDGASATDCTTGGGSTQVLCLCSNNAWAAVGGAVSTAASFAKAPASPSAYDCEFTSGICSGWTTYTAAIPMDSGTVSPISTASGNPIYDTTTRPGWILFQSDESSATVYGLKYASISQATNATWFFHANATLRDMASNEGGFGFGLFNAGDSNEWIYLALDSGGGNLQVYDGINNNGAVAYTLRNWPADQGYGTGDFYGAIIKESNSYHFWVWTSDLGYAHYMGSRSKTGVTTLDEARFYVLTSNDSPRVITALDFIRYYASATFALTN